MTKIHSVLAGPLFIAILGAILCIFSAFGNDVSFCVTTGCTLYHDFTIAGVSLWLFGLAAFALLAILALLGRVTAGRLVSGLFLLADICLLILMSLTAPCISCLAVALLLALSYFLFRRHELASAPNRQANAGRRHSFLLFVWLILFVINLGQVARSQFDVWPILDESGDARTRMFFSPSCKYCMEGINLLSGNIDVAFYPVAENDADVYRLARMIILLDDGLNLAEALAQSRDAQAGGFMESLRPDILLLRFRLLRNKAHLFAAGSHGVPFFEIRGLPPELVAKAAEKNRKDTSGPNGNGGTQKTSPAYQGTSNNPGLPAELNEFGQCVGSQPCPPEN